MLIFYDLRFVVVNKTVLRAQLKLFMGPKTHDGVCLSVVPVKSVNNFSCFLHILPSVTCGMSFCFCCLSCTALTKAILACLS